MKKILLFSISLLHSVALLGQSEVEFKVRFSEPYAAYDFITKISDNYPDNDLKKIFLESRYNTAFYKQRVSRLENLAIDYAYFYRQYPQPLKAGLMSRDLLEKNLALSETAAEFINKSIGIIPSEDLSAFAEILREFIPIYRELIFEPNKEALALQEKSLEAYVNGGQFTTYFKAGLAFYNTVWDPGIPFELCLLPSLEKGNIGARAFFNVAVCEASLDLKQHNVLFSVAMHEIDHIIYDNQSLDMKQNVQHWFDNTRSKNRQYALLLLNEVLATALGNAYVMEQLKGRVEDDDWYDNKYITAMAKEIYPLVKTYIQQGKPMDENFVKAYVEKYDVLFPHWNNELEHLLAYRYIVADDAEDLRYFRRNYRKYSNNRAGSPISAAEIEKMEELPVTKVFVISKDHKKTLKLVQDNFELLKKVKLNYRKEFIEVIDLEDGTKLIVINRHTSGTEDLMNRKFPEKKINK